MTEAPWISILTAFPLAAGMVCLMFGERRPDLVRWGALGASLIALALMGALWWQFNGEVGQVQWVERFAWIPTLGVEYFAGLDGISLVFVALTAWVTPMAILAAWRVRERVHLYFGLVLLLQGGLFGTFTALNFFHWFLYYELSLVPAFLLIKLWGGASRSAAAMQFFVYTMAGSVALLLAFVGIYLATGTFDFIRLAEMGSRGEVTQAIRSGLAGDAFSGETMAALIFAGVLLGFAVKVPMVPFHTWLPAAYAEAPSPVTMLLTGILSKMGVYGFLRILFPIFPDMMEVLLPWLLGLAVATIVLSAGAAFAQRDLKRVFAYSSINHLGYCLLGIFAASTTGEGAGWMADRSAALAGVLVQVFNHGITAAALFAFVAMIEWRSEGLRGIEEFGGLRRVVPVLCALMGISMFASLGLPGLNGFIGEFLIFKGVFGLAPWAAAASALGLLITAAFLLNVMERIFHGPVNERWSGMSDLDLRERLTVVPAVGLMFLVGVWPQLLTGPLTGAILRWAGGGS